MSLKELKTSLRLDMVGNLLQKTGQLSARLAAVGKTGSYSMALLNKSLTAADRSLDRLGNRYSAILTGAGSAMAVKNAADLELRLTRLGIQAEISQKEVNNLNNEIYRISQMRDININPDQLLSGVEKIVSKTGNLEFAQENLKNLAYAISATGAAGEDVGAMAADIFEKFNVTSSEEMIATLGLLVNQGKAGAFELRDLATQGERVTAAYGQLGRTGADAVAEMGAMLQMARKAAGSPEQAATALEAFIRNINAVEKRKMLLGAGIQLMDPEDPNRMRSAIDIAKDLITLTKGDVSKIGKVIDAEGIRALNAMIIEFKQTGRFDTVDSFRQISKDSSGLIADSARVAKTFSGAVTSLKTAWSAFANRNLAEPISRLAAALNKISPEQLDRWLNIAGKIALGLGALVVGNKIRHGIGSVLSIFGNVKSGTGRTVAGLVSGSSNPIPVYVVNAASMGGGLLADGADMLGASGSRGRFGKVARFMARHRGLAKVASIGGKVLKYGGKALGLAGMAYSVYGLTQAENGKQLGASIGSIAGGLIGAIGGPIGMAAGSVIGNYLGEKVGGWFDDRAKEKESIKPEVQEIVKTEAKVYEMTKTPWAKSETKISLDFNPITGQMTPSSISENASPYNMTMLDLSLGGRNVL